MATDVCRAAGSFAGQKTVKSVSNARRRRVLDKVLAGREPDKESYRPSEVVTFFTSDGLVQLPKWQAPSKAIIMKKHNPLPTWQEQGLCIGNTFWVTATNGLDIYRRLNLMGYCRCTELLSDVVEHTVLSSGGEIVIREHKSSSGLHESLHMTVAIPLLWGIPSRHETLSTAIVSGGGYVEKVYRQWQLLGSTNSKKFHNSHL
ncbi:hypothetical protein WJX79_006751 [Trebouxia sp. C0005]